LMVISNVTKSGSTVTHVEVSDGWPPNMRRINYTASSFNTYLSSISGTIYKVNIGLLRKTFPRWKTPSDKLTIPIINDTLLLDFGDKWVYSKGETVKFNILSANANSLVIKKDNVTIETISPLSAGVIERTYNSCGDYEAYCVMSDLSLSLSVNFKVASISTTNYSAISVNSGDSFTVDFDFENCFPVYHYCYNLTGTIILRIDPLTKAEITNKQIIVSTAEIPAGRTFLYFIEAETSFGRIITSKTEITII
jgi:hypothetical protein